MGTTRLVHASVAVSRLAAAALLPAALSACVKIKDVRVEHRDRPVRSFTAREVPDKWTSHVELVEQSEASVSVRVTRSRQCRDVTHQVVDRTSTTVRDWDEQNGTSRRGLYTWGGIALGVGAASAGVLAVSPGDETADQKQDREDATYGALVVAGIGAVLLGDALIGEARAVDRAQHVGDVELEKVGRWQVCDRSPSSGATVSLHWPSGGDWLNAKTDQSGLATFELPFIELPLAPVAYQVWVGSDPTDVTVTLVRAPLSQLRADGEGIVEQLTNSLGFKDADATPLSDGTARTDYEHEDGFRVELVGPRSSPHAIWLVVPLTENGRQTFSKVASAICGAGDCMSDEVEQIEHRLTERWISRERQDRGDVAITVFKAGGPRPFAYVLFQASGYARELTPPALPPPPPEPPPQERTPPVRRTKPTSSPSGGSRLLCCDGTLSPTCMCAGSHRGCCSHHRGVCGCE